MTKTKNSKPKQKKYLVVSYDGGQQEFFYDFVLAENTDAAELQVLRVREYVDRAAAIERTLAAVKNE